jgi:hypothetical protein
MSSWPKAQQQPAPRKLLPKPDGDEHRSGWKRFGREPPSARGNVTGPSLQTAELAGKRLQLLTEIVPGLGRAAVLSNPVNPSIAASIEQTRATAQSLGIEVYIVDAPGPDQFESAFSAVTRARRKKPPFGLSLSTGGRAEVRGCWGRKRAGDE